MLQKRQGILIYSNGDFWIRTIQVQGKTTLQVGEEITQISVDGVTVETYEKIIAHFNTQEIANIILCLINLMNR